MSSTPPWTLHPVYPVGSDVGYLYSKGRAAVHGAELLVRGLHRDDVKPMAGFLNHIGIKTLKEGETAKMNDNHGYVLRARSANASKRLVVSHLVGVAPRTRVVELVHDGCFVERTDGMVLLSRKLPSGRVLHVDTMDGAMLNGGSGILHRDFNNANNAVSNLAYVGEIEARQALAAFEE